MRNAFNLALALIIALLAGLGGTWYALSYQQGVETVSAGPWRAAIEIGPAGANPYVRAMLARTGAIPMLATESIVFRTANDSRGQPLRGACVYRLRGQWIDTRWWTLTVTDEEGGPLSSDGPHAATSLGVVRDKQGGFEVTLSPKARPGNWLASGGPGRRTLTLRLYDTPLYLTGGLEEIVLPEIVTESCP